MEEPLFDDIVEPEEVEPAVLPVAIEPLVLPVADAPPGVPVAPMGVLWVLVWPAPTAGLAAGVGGALWAKASEAASTAEAATRVLVVADIQDLLFAL